ncbi:MAG: glycosyltransferase, partial [Anaeroplasmataceae bacterium]
MIVYILPFFINSFNVSEGLNNAKTCFDSLELCEDVEIVIYNQGIFTNSVLKGFLEYNNFKYHIIGDGENVGISIARNACLQYVWEKIPNATYIVDIHVDMIFTPHWTDPLIEFLENSSEPCISPRIVYYESDVGDIGFKVTGKDSLIDF